MLLLKKDKYHLASESLAQVSINHLFANAVAQNMVSGMLYANHSIKPSDFYVVHPYGLSLLFGTDPDPDFSNLLFGFLLNPNKKSRLDHWIQFWPQAYSSVADEQIRALLPSCGARLNKYERVNFSFNKAKFCSIHQPILPEGCTIIETNQQIFENMPGTVIPSRFWDKSDDFLRHGKGFSLINKGQLASTAYSVFVIDNKMEIGIETILAFRGKGHALAVCHKMIEYCLQKNFEPVWACRADNQQSIALATKLGFEETVRIPFFHLTANVSA